MDKQNCQHEWNWKEKGKHRYCQKCNLNQKGYTILSKSDLMIPHRFALEMVKNGWLHRQTIIWHKRNCMPSSVKDRFTVDFEYLFFFTKSKKYWFETQYEPLSEAYLKEKRPFGVLRQRLYPNSKYMKEEYGSNQFKARKEFQAKNAQSRNGRNKRAVWTINTKPYKEAHFAVFPPELVETPIRAGCPENGAVLDPFAGSGTVCEVAEKLGRNSIGIELKPEYAELIKKRMKPYLEQTKFDGKTELEVITSFFRQVVI